MTPFLDKLRLAAKTIKDALTRFWERSGPFFLPNPKNPGRFATRKQREMEAERLDRLRNPRNYQGR